jgi:sporulation protein YlmC with PRC-barrel domain
MKIKFGVDVNTFDGEKIGTVKQVVIDPATQEISHLIIEKGLLFKEDKVLPISLILQANEEEVKLVETDEDLEELPEYQEEYYLPIDAEPMYDPELALSRNFLIAKPRIVPKQQEEVRYIKKGDYQENLPEDTKMLRVGAEVFSLDREEIGRVSELVLDFQTDQITHLVLDRALLRDDRVLIPYQWVDDVSQEKVTLLVDQEVIKNLPSYLEEE